MRKALSRVIAACALLAVLLCLGGPVWAAPLASPERQGTIHIVQWGENLTMIARRYGVTTTAIVQANGLANPNYIYAGQSLIIPTGGAPAPPPPPGGTTTYVVKPGDTLSAIAACYGTTVNELVALNGLWNPNLIYVGQVLKVPGGAPPIEPPVEPPEACIYWVKPGDTLTRIALQYGTTVWAIAIANNLANPSFIWVGQQLIIPGCAEGPTPTPTTPPQATATPTSTPTGPGPTPTATPTPTPTNTPPSTAWEYTLVRGPDKDPCHPGYCIPEVSGVVNDARGNSLSNATPAWIKLDSEKHGTMYTRTGDPAQLLQEGLFKFVSPNGDKFGVYTLTVVRGQNDPAPLSPTYDFKMNSFVTGGQQSNIVFQHN
jgi:LysM repeat protein